MNQWLVFFYAMSHIDILAISARNYRGEGQALAAPYGVTRNNT